MADPLRSTLSEASSAHAVPPRLRDPVAHLLGLLRAEPRRRWVVGIVGLPGAGKSTIAQALAAAVNARAGAATALALGMDGFHLTRAQLRAMPDPAAALARRGAPWTFDPQGLSQRLGLLRAQPGQAHGWPGFEHGVGDPAPDAIQVAPEVRLVLLEGLYLLHDEHGWDLGGGMDACWFLDVPMDVAMDRLAARHQAAWGITRDEALARLARNDRLNAQIVWAGRGRADALIGDALTGDEATGDRATGEELTDDEASRDKSSLDKSPGDEAAGQA